VPSGVDLVPPRRSELIRLVARREIVTRLRERSFLISTAITIVIVVGIIVVPQLLSRGEDRYTIGLVADAPATLEPALWQAARTERVTVYVPRYPDAVAARAAVDAGSANAVFVGDDQVVVKDQLDGKLASVVQAAYRHASSLQRLQAAGIDPAQVTEALTVPPLAVDSLAGAGDSRDARRGAAFFGVVLLYGQLIGYSLWVAFGVVEEKSSRVVELLLSTLRPWQLLTGKIIGIGLLGLLQLVLVGAIGVAAALGSGAVSLPADLFGVIGQVLLWFLLGYAFYACAYAAAAALVTRQEELQNITGPLTILLVGSFFMAIIAVEDPRGQLARIASLVPPFSLMTMPPRWAGGDVSWWELALSIVLMLIAVVALVRLAGRVYAGAVLRSGPRVKVREVLRYRHTVLHRRGR
jgi:ABC-2 type transport system permease protein